jgi:hypothetical protein
MRPVLSLLILVLLAACAQAPTPPEASAPSPTAEAAAPTVAPPTSAPATVTAVPPTPIPPSPTAAPAAALEAVFGYGQARGAAIAPDGETLAAATEAGVLLLHLPDLSTLRFIPLAEGAHQVDVSPGGQYIAAGVFAGSSWKTTLLTAEGAAVRELPGAQPRFSPDGASIAVVELDHASGRYTTRLFAVEDGAEIGAVAGEAPRFSPDGGMLATNDREELIISQAGGAELLRQPAFLAAFDPNGAAVVISGPAGIERIALRDSELELASRRLLSPSGARDMAFDAEGRLLAFTEAGLVRWGPAAEGEPELLQAGMDAEIPRFGPQALMVALTVPISDAPSPLSLARAEDGKIVYEELEFEGGQPVFSSDGRLAAVVTAAGELRLVDVEQGQVAERRLPGYTMAAFGPDGAIAAARPGPQVDLYPATGGEAPARSLGAYAFWQLPRGLAVEADGAVTAVIERSSFSYTMGFALWRWAAGSPDEEPVDLLDLTGQELVLDTPGLWDYAHGRFVWAPEPGILRVEGGDTGARDLSPAEAATAAALGPGGALLAVGGFEGGVSVIDQDGTERRLGELGRPVSAVAFSPDGAAVAAVARNGAIGVWGVAGGHELLRATTGALVDEGATDRYPERARLAFSPEGELLIVAGQSGAVAYRVADGAKLLSLAGPATDVAFAADGARVAIVRQGRVEIWRIQ